MTSPVSLPCTGVIMAGGAAQRYGGLPKGLEYVGGRRIIDRVADALGAVCNDLLLIANHAEAAQWLPGVRHAADVIPAAGSVGGVHAGLVHAARPVLVVAWDMPFVPAGLLADLAQLGEREGADVAVPESGSRRGVEPLCAWYAPGCVPAIERALARDDRRVIGFFDDVRVARLQAERVRSYGDPEWLFMNVNTPDELVRAEAHARSAHGGDHRTQEQRQDDAPGEARG